MLSIALQTVYKHVYEYVYCTAHVHVYVHMKSNAKCPPEMGNGAIFSLETFTFIHLNSNDIDTLNNGHYLYDEEAPLKHPEKGDMMRLNKRCD